jgi:MFS family permease
MAIERRTVQVMSIACAVSVANIYYCQPLLSSIAQSLGIPGDRVAFLPMYTQAGTALGMLSFVPLGDMFPRRMLIVTMCVATVFATMLIPPSRSLPWPAFSQGLPPSCPTWCFRLPPNSRRTGNVGEWSVKSSEACSPAFCSRASSAAM